MQVQGNRRSRGTGSIIERADAAGRVSLYAKFVDASGRQVKRRIGAKRTPGSREGFTRQQAEAALRKLIETTTAAPAVADRITVSEAGERWVEHLEGLGRKPATISAYRSDLRVHIEPAIGARPLHRVTREDIERLVTAKLRAGSSPKTVRNVLSVVHGVFAWAERRGLVASNPARLVDRPRVEPTTDIRWIDVDDLEAIIGSVPAGIYAATDRALILAAAMTGLRQGELLALRWLDLDWPSSRVRVRRTLTAAGFGAPKSLRGSRSVPLADRVAGVLDAHFQGSAYTADDDLVFAHPQSGRPLDRHDLHKRFRSAVAASGVRPIRFHDLRHTFGTTMAAAGIPMRTLQEWLGHRDLATTAIYADFQPGERDAEIVARAFAPRPNVSRGLHLPA